MNGARWLGLMLLVFATAAPSRAENLLVVCPPAWRDSLDEWTAVRRAQGHDIRLAGAEASDIPFTGEPFGLLLIGDGRHAGPAPATLPARIISQYGPEATIACDGALADRCGADYAARLPFANEDALRAYLKRVVRHPESPASRDTRRLLVSAGEGGFSPLIDAAIEGAARRLFAELAPAGVDITLRPASDPIGPNRSASRGGVWVWLGHGLRDRLPGVPPERLVTTLEGADLAVLIACYAGDFAAPGDCVAEQLLKAPEGPLAVIASTRVSMPYGNARLGGELLIALGRNPDGAIGGLLAEAKRSSLREEADARLEGLDAIAQLLGAAEDSLPVERREHAAMYHLLGDPLLRAYPVSDRVAAKPLGAPVR